MKTYDLIVVGAGPVGLATAWHAARRGRSVLVLEQYDPSTGRGSSGGAERQWRLQYAQEDLTRLTLEALPYWRELERAAGRRLIHATGSLWFGDIDQATNEGQIAGAAAILERVGVDYEWLTAREIEKRYGFAGLPAAYEGFYQPDGGMIDVGGTRWALHEQALIAGAEVVTRRRVIGLSPDRTGVTVRTTDAAYRAERVVVAAGAFAGPLLAPLGITLDVELLEMTSCSFRLRDPATELPTWFAFERATEEDTNLFYGFGRNPWAADDLVRAGPDFEDRTLPGPYDAGRVPDPRHLERVTGWIAEHLPVLVPEPVEPRTCLIALPHDPGRQFYLGPVPGAERIVVHSAGWGFKYVPLFGRACAELALDGSTAFDLDRMAFAGGPPTRKAEG
ncbi:FAD-dependent oxidoreductase [Actinoplanes sp. NPDC051470]|uniref:FAD-dependent oxidoreductase n=1 Tax=unclassified Actinoplanes TaxID=2626549 RepID=UPI00341238F7